MPDEKISIELIIDTKGHICPYPLIELKKGIKKLSAGQKVKLITTDPICPDNVDSWCEATGNRLLKMDKQNDVIFIYVQKV